MTDRSILVVGGTGKTGRGRLARALTVLLTLGVLAALGAALLRLVPGSNSRWMFVALSFTPYTLASANLYYGRADPRAVVDLVRTHRVDVLSLQELTPEAVAALDAAGLAALLPHRVFQPDARAAGTGVASRYRYRCARRTPTPTTFNLSSGSMCPGPPRSS